jgi:16S rRNA (uracil1498-N3)-methyltransferase
MPRAARTGRGDAVLPRFLAPDAGPDADRVRLPEDEAHHLARVLRLGVAARVAIFDGRGGEWEGRVATLDRTGVTVALDRPVDPVAEPGVRLTLAVGLLKGAQMDAIVADATALGVRAIVPIASAHVSLPPRAWKSGGARERWRRVAVAAAKQCGRAVVPDIRPVAAFDEVLAAAGDELIVMALEPAAGDLPALGMASPPAAAFALVGPEGGWAAGEIARAAARGAHGIRLGPRRLRADTAPTVLLSALWTRWGW